MKRYIAAVLVLALFLISALPCFASAIDVGINRIVYLVYNRDGDERYAVISSESTVYNIYLTFPDVTHNNVTVVLEGNFLVGAEYTLQYVLYDPNFVPDGMTGQGDYASFTSGSSVQTDLLVTYSAIDASVYPNPYSDVSDQDYVSNSHLVSVTFTPKYSTGKILVGKNGYYDAERIYMGVSHVSLRTTYDEVESWYLQKIYDRTGSIYNFLTGSLTTLLNSMHTTISSGFDMLHQDLNNLITAIGSGFNMSAGDEQDFADMEEDAESFNDAAAEKQEQTNAAVQQQQQVNQDKQEQVDDLKQQQDDFNRIEEDFKGSYGSSANFEDINQSINQQITGEYGGAIIWWGEVFGEFFSFAPLKTMLNVSVFFGLLMLLFGVGTRAGLRVSTLDRRKVKHSD